MSAHRRSPAALAVTLSLATALAACTSGEPSAPVRGPVDSAPAASPTPDLAGAYRETLRSAAGPLGSALDGLPKARTLKSLDQRLERAQSAAGDAVERLVAASPPAEIGAEHSDYLAALRGLDGDLGTLRDAVAGHELCAPSAVLARLGGTDGYGAVKDAGGELAAKGDYPADVARLKTPKEQSRRLSNGAFIRRGPRGGLGHLIVKNGATSDTVISVVRGKRAVTRFYIRKGKNVTVTGVPDGTYKVYYTSGSDWDRRTRAFTRDCLFKKFGKDLAFRTQRTATYIRPMSWTITLRPVIGGNVRSVEVDPEDFPG
ncbi:hypothetical protein Ssi03_28620 [Sphaerisporangium siamense]|uniref:Lipoprotein n=1 Tax=Sphaerisporangium siamense TaxID=795645 RepID=A0A7W7DCR2_9ACTN|nr:hypothetical protein [Sphaerisporangium siamense]MBB4704444.1 hypothetical protein [Sphaerisporangium siamense]GII84872.1 hypothetical protein Ssi03_28620 [Sphaerisporangium siamense]